MRFVEEEDELGLVEIPYLRHRLVQLREHPEQKGRVNRRREHQFVGRQNVDVPAALFVRPHQIAETQCRLTKETIATALLERQQTALDRADACRGDIAVLGGDRFRVVADELEHRPQIFEIQQQQSLIVGIFERDLEHAGLGIVQTQ